MNGRGSPELLARARILEEARDYPGIVALLEPPDDTHLAEPELGYRLAYAWRRVGRSRDALSLTEALEAPVRRRAEDPLARRRVSLEAMLRYDIGEVSRAEQLWERLAADATEAGDHVLAAAAFNNLGVVRTLQDRTEEALASYNRALLASRRLGDRRGLAQAHQNLAILYREKGLGREADSHFRQAIDHARASGSEDVLGRAEEERALLFLDRDDEPMASITARRALERLGGIDDVGGAGEARRVLGIVALRGRHQAEARRFLQEALEDARVSGSALLRAETLEALALLEAVEGRADRAESHRREAADLFDGMGAAAWGRRIRSRTAAFARV
ncbi:MAG: tetratricopeptide repeat protein [Gemmatimonadetes bacterium]|nr:tetratricopeptide repeat protein [Gemmatimonadota bacterium]